MKILRGWPVKNPKIDFTDIHFPNSRGESNQKTASPLSFEERICYLHIRGKKSHIDFLGLELSLSTQDSAACLG